MSAMRGGLPRVMAFDEGEGRLNWTKVGTVAGALLFVVLIVVVAVGPGTCSHKDFPFLCLVTQFFRH